MPKIIGNTTAAPKVLTEAEVITLVTSSEEVKDLIKEHGGDMQVQADWNQDNQKAPDYILNKPEIPSIEGLATEAFVEEKIAEVDVSADVTYTNSDPLLQDMGGILANNHPEGFNKVPINDLITELLYPYTKPSIGTLSLDPIAGVYQKNVDLEVTQASITVTKKSKSIQSVTLYRGDTELQSKTDGVAAGGTFSFTLSDELLAGTTNTSYKVKVTEAGEGGKTYESGAVGYTFVYPFYYGVIGKNATVDSKTIRDFKKSIINKKNHTYSYTTTNECPVIAYPKDYGTLKSIIDPNNFTQEWTRSEVTVIDGETIPNIDYYIYVGGAATATNTTYKFNFS